MSDSSTAEHTHTPALGSQPARTRQTLGAVALIVAVGALLVAGWASWQLQQLQRLPDRINMDATRIAGLTRQVDILAAASSRQEQQLEDLATSLEDGLAILPELVTRIGQSEQALAGLAALDANSRSDWLKAEALYYLQIANTEALLAADPKVAATALQFADDRLRALDDPALAPVRAQLTTDLTTLRALPQVDHAGMAFRLQALADQAATWPLRSGAPESFTPAVRPTETVVGSLWQRMVAALKSAFASLVSIKQTRAPAATQLGAADRALLVATIKAELQLARVALVGNDARSFRQSLQQVSAQLRQYFDTQSAAVTAALATLDELQATELQGALPDISGALKLLQADVAASPAGEAR